MIRVESCTRCERSLPSGAPLGLCPSCLFSAVLAVESTDSGNWPGDDESTHGSVESGWPSSGSQSTEEGDDFSPDRPDGETLPHVSDSHSRDWLSLIGVPCSPAVPGYENLGLIGKGGMGIVYKALQCRANRLVALKMIRGGADLQPDQLERFRFEVEAAALLRHPNVVQIYEVGEADGRPFFSLELLEGGTLKEKLAAAPIPPRPAAGLLAEIARAIDAAHIAGIIHRDLKPSNILFDSLGTPKITDFGLAKRLESDAGQTVSGQVVGTPSYMAPEQARGDKSAVGTAVDIYALGAVLYEMLTGSPPFRGATPSDTIQLVINQEPVSPSRLQPRIPRALETICLKCLAKEPSRRYATAGELADDLGRFLAGELILARPAPAWERAANWAKRKPATALSATLALIGAVAIAFAAAWYGEVRRADRLFQYGQDMAQRQKAADDVARSAELKASGDLDEARLILKTLLARLQAHPRLGDLRGRVDAELAVVERRRTELTTRQASLAEFKANLGRFRRLRDEALFRDAEIEALWRDPTTGDPVRGPGRLLKTRDSAREALGIFAGDDGGTPRALPEGLEDEQRSEVAAGCYLMLMVLSRATANPLAEEDSRHQAQEALRLLDRAERLSPGSVAIHLRRAYCLDRLGDIEAARVEREKAKTSKPVDAFDHILFGQELSRQGDWESARSHFLAALGDQNDLFIAHALLATAALNCPTPEAAEARAELTYCIHQQPSYAWLYLLRGFASTQMGAALMNVREPGQAETFRSKAESRFDEAETDFRTAIGLDLEDDLRYVLLMNRGVMRFLRRREELSASDFREAVTLDASRYNAYASLAQSLRRLGQRREAVEQFDKAIALAPGIAALFRGRAAARTDADKPTPADLRAAVLDLDESASREPEGSRARAEDHAGRARLLLSLDQTPEGLSAALQAADAALATDNSLAEAHRVRVKILLELKRFDKAIEACDAALAGLPTSPTDARLHFLRGLGRTGRHDFTAAIEDFTIALTERPDWQEAYLQRGWTYLAANAPEMASHDFEKAIGLAPDDPSGYAGRGVARVRRGQIRPGLFDAEESVRRAGPAHSSRILYIAGQSYAQASAWTEAEARRRGRPVSRDALDYESRAETLLRQALEKTPAESRLAFWNDYLAKDPALKPLFRNPKLLKRLKPSDAPAL